MKYYIIIPTYNEEKFISLTLQSLVEQSVVPTKIVVVNDNSTDKTPEIVSEFASNYSFITLINRMSNGRIIFPNMTLSAIDNDCNKNRKSK